MIIVSINILRAPIHRSNNSIIGQWDTVDLSMRLVINEITFEIQDHYKR